MAYRAASSVVALASLMLCPRVSLAQVWGPPKGEGSVAILYQDLRVKDHLTATGARQNRGRITSNNLLFDVTYGMSDRITVTFAVPFVRARYAGTTPHPTGQDDGHAHGGFQDARFGVRFNVYQGPIAITPFVGVNVPTHRYEYFAHAAYGTRMREVEVGAYVGRVVNVGDSNAFVQARYSYGIPQQIADIAHKRSSLDLEVGYFVTRDVRVFVQGAGQKTHGGIDVPDAGWKAMPPELAPHHDRIARVDMLDVGVGMQVTLSRSLDVFGSYVSTAAGRNGHALDRGITLGASWSFGRGIGKLLASAEPRKQMAKCLCQE